MSTSSRPAPSPAAVGTRKARSVAVVVVTGLLVAWTGSVASAATAVPPVTVTVTGTLENVVVDNDRAIGTGATDGATAVEPFIRVGGVLHDLPQGTVVPPGPTGEDVQVTLAAAQGVTGAQALDLAAADVVDPAASVLDVLPLASAATSAAVAAVTAGVVLGTHTLTILPVTGGAQDVSTGQLSTLAADTAAYWSEQSAGTVAISYSVRAWASIADPYTCDVSALYNAAMAANPGVAAPSLTNHVLVYFPYRADCPFAGRAALLGGTIWDNGAPLVDVTAHEFGHNLGLGHANETLCTSGASRVPLSGSCTNTEYADRADLMGYATTQRSGNLNSGLADALGFAHVTTIPAGTSSAVTVDLAPLSQMSAMRAVKIPVPTGNVFVDFRPAAGRDVRVPAWAGVQVHLRTTDGWGIPTTYLLDMQPTAPTPFASPQLPAGASWLVPGTALIVTVIGVGSTARVQVGPNATVSQYITRVYSDLFGRVPDPTGLQTWTTALGAGTPRIAVANAITYSTEYRSGLIGMAYHDFLARAPEPAGLASWLAAMNRGLTIEQMEGGFLASPEYYAQSGGTDAGWVNRLYLHVLGRTAAPSEVASWVSHLAATGDKFGVSMGFLLSTERLSTVVDGQYVLLLGRHIDPSGRQTWVGLIQRGARDEAIIGGIIASDEYYARP